MRSKRGLLLAALVAACGGRTALDSSGGDLQSPFVGLGGTATTPPSGSAAGGATFASGTVSGGQWSASGRTDDANAIAGAAGSLSGATGGRASSMVAGSSGGSSTLLGGSTATGNTNASSSAPTGGKLGSGGTQPNGGSSPAGGTATTGGTGNGGSLIDNMEDASGFICPSDGRKGAWYAFGADGGTQWPEPTAPGTPIQTSPIPGGRESSLLAMHTYGQKSPYAGIGFDLNFDGTNYGSYDASAFDGIDFWARGSAAAFWVRFSTIPTTSTEYGGTCTLEDPPQHQGCQPHSRTIKPTADWWHYWIPFSSLEATRQPPNDEDIVFQRSQLTNVQFYVSGSFDFWVDDVSFFKGRPGCCTPLPTGCDPGLVGFDEQLKRLIASGAAEPTRCEDICYIETIYSANELGDPLALRGLECSVSLREITLRSAQIDDIGPLQNAARVSLLDLANNAILDITPTSVMTGLRSLDLTNNRVTDLAPLSGLTQLTTVRLGNNRVERVKPLGSSKGMVTLQLGSNQVSDLNGIEGLTQLTALDLSSNRIADISPLRALTLLGTLSLADNAIADIKPLSVLTGLTSLDLSRNPLISVAPLSTLTSLNVLGLNSTNMETVEALAHLPTLRELDLGNNAIHDIRPLSSLKYLSVLDISNNQVPDPTPLAALSDLHSLDASGNGITEMFTLQTAVYFLALARNRISDLGFLANASVSSLDMSNNLISKLDQLLTFDWVTRRVSTPSVKYQRYTFDFSGNPIDCAEQAKTIEALDGYSIDITVDCP